MIDVWRIDVRRSRGDPRLLSPDEVDRAARFRFEHGREAFVSTRAALRTLVGSHVGLAPEEVVFGYGPEGKPEASGVSFSVSHSGDVALIALARTGRIGVDVEDVRRGGELRALARRFFTPAENEALDRLSGDDFARGFYGCWTQKEAFVKAVGKGVSFGLDRVEVAVHPAPAGLVSIDGDEAAAAAWTIMDVDAGSGYAGALAVDAPGARAVVHDWPGSAAA